MLAVAAMASCAKSELAERPAAAGEVELKLGSTVYGIESRAPFIGTIGNTASLTARVLVSTATGVYFESPGANYVANSTVTFTDEATQQSLSPNAYYPANGDAVYLLGLYPANTWTFNNSTDVTLDFTGNQDIMFATEVSSTKALAQAGNYPVLAFKHQLARYDIKVKGDSEAAEYWGKIKGMELSGGKNGSVPESQCKVTFADGSVTFDGSDPIHFYLVKNGNDYSDTQVGIGAGDADYITLTETETLAAYAMVAPVTFTNQNDYITLKVFTENGKAGGEEVKVKLTDSTGSPYLNVPTTGKVFTITLNFTSTEITPKASVDEWEDNGDKGEQTIQ